MKTPIPELPIIRHEVAWTDLSDRRGSGVFHVNRNICGAEKTGGPDTIYLNDWTSNVHVTVTFTPAQVVHMANAMLTDEERAAILFPVAAGGVP